MTRNELVLGVAIVAVAISATTALLAGAADDQARGEAERDARALREGAAKWFAQGGDPHACPTVSRLIEDGALGRGVRRDDPWGARFRVECAGDDVTVVSPGPDGRSGTEDDVRATP